MSANIYWRPIKKGKDIEVNAPSSFMQAFGRAFGTLPLTLKNSDLEKLRGLWAGYQNEKSSIEALIRAIEEHGEIEVYADY